MAADVITENFKISLTDFAEQSAKKTGHTTKKGGTWLKFVSFTHRYTRVLRFGFYTLQKQHKSLVEMLIKTPELDNIS